MKLIGRMLIAVAVLSLVAAALPFGVSVFDNPAAVAAEDLENVHLDINGMTCGGCSAKVTKALTKLPEVKEADVSWKAGGADLKVTKGSNHKALVKAVEKAGFDVSEVACECKG
ncbi:MAG: heavy-metal-associated domain-containing protein [Candidatus Brocadiales bacterium]